MDLFSRGRSIQKYSPANRNITGQIFFFEKHIKVFNPFPFFWLFVSWLLLIEEVRLDRSLMVVSMTFTIFCTHLSPQKHLVLTFLSRHQWPSRPKWRTLSLLNLVHIFKIQMLTYLQKAQLWINKIAAGVNDKNNYPSSIYCSVVIPQYCLRWPPTNNNLLNIGHEIIRNSTWVFTKVSTRMSPNRIEVPR
jgi:hypothetical protein